jgi:hypothetical protein
MQEKYEFTPYESSGDIIYEETLDYRRALRVQSYIAFPILALVFILFIVLGGGLGETLVMILIMLIPSMLLTWSNARVAKKVYFRILSDGIETGRPREHAFIPFDSIIWVGTPPKAFDYSLERRFDVVDVKGIYPAPVMTFSRGILIIYKGLDYNFGLIVYPEDPFIARMKNELKQRVDSDRIF